MNDPASTKGGISKWIAMVGPGLLVAATGVGAGDLAGAAIAGNRMGVAILWGVLLGAFFKYVQNEGLARWQLATGTTLLDGVLTRYPWVRVPFLVYFLIWSFLVGAALMSACGVASHAMLPCFADPVHDKIFYGVLHSAAGYALVRYGGFALFEKLMSAGIAIMFVIVVGTAVLIWPGTEAVLRGLFVPSIPNAGGEGVQWTIALIGGVGGTLTILCYGYWIREEGREGIAHLPGCRVDLLIAYLMTAMFGIGMVIIGSTIEVKGGGAALIVNLAGRLGDELGSVGKWAFLLGAWGAIVSSLLGVWQSVPYLFADIMRRRTPASSSRPATGSLEKTRHYRLFSIAIATLPIIGLSVGFARMQKLYALTGALFMPMLAVALLHMNRSKRVGEENATRPLGVITLVAVLLFFFGVGAMEIRGWLT